MEKLNPKERTGLIKNVGLPKADILSGVKLAAAGKKLEKTLKGPKLKRASLVYDALRGIPGEETLFVLSRSNERLVLDRVKNYLQKYLVMALEITDEDVAATGATPGTPKFAKAKQTMIAKHLDARPKKIVPEEEPVPLPSAPIVSRARG